MDQADFVHMVRLSEQASAQDSRAYRRGVAAFAALGLLWVSLRALWMRLDAPEGQLLTAHEAPTLFEALERMRKKIHGPPIHAVYLDAEFNASIRQTPHWGLLGGGEHAHHRPAAADGTGQAAALRRAGTRVRPLARRPWALRRLDLPHPAVLAAPA